MLSISSRNKKRIGTTNNRRIQGTHLNLYNPKVTTVGFQTEKKPRTWTSLAPVIVNNDKNFPPLSSPALNPLVLSPINQVLGSWSYDSNLPPPEVLLSKVEYQREEPSVQFDEKNEPLEITLNCLIVATNKVYTNQRELLNEMMLLKTKKKGLALESLLFRRKLLEFIKQNQLLIALCRHVKC